MLTQFLAACHLPGHPGHKHLGLPPPPCNLSHHHTLLDYEPEVAQLIPRVVDRPAYKTAIKELHTTTVSKVLRGYENNEVLLHPPPSINPEEIKLTRYKGPPQPNEDQATAGSWIHTPIQNKLHPRYNTHHLYHCRENPTILTVQDLWTRPTEVALFLKDMKIFLK